MNRHYEDEWDKQMVDLLRTLLGIRKKRKSLPTDLEPKRDARIVRNNLEIKLEQPVAPELWDWMLLSGWRVNPAANDRRRYVRLSPESLQQLIVASNESRPKVHARLISKARRPH